MNIKELRQKKADLLAEGDKLFAQAQAENRVLTDLEAKRDDEISAELTKLNADIERVERHMARQRQEVPQAGSGLRTPDAPSGGAFSSFGEMLQAVARVGVDSRMSDSRLVFEAVGTGANEGVAADGGFLVDTTLVPGMFTNMWDSGAVLSRVTNIPIGANSNGIKMNGVDEMSRVNGSRWGGIRAYWTGEAALMTASQPKFKRIAMELDKVTALLYATDELLQDQTALQAWISQAFPAEMTFKIEDSIFAGTGSGMPLGFLNSGALITVNKESSQPAATVQPENIVKMWARMPAKNRANAVWYINQDVEPQLMLMTLKVKNVAGTENVGGVAIPPVIYTPPGTNGNQYATLMGRPVIPVEYCATLGTAGDIMLVDPSQYLTIDKGGVKQDSSIHVRFLYNETAFRFTYRINGQPLWQTAMTPYKGSNTLSPFIALQTR